MKQKGLLFLSLVILAVAGISCSIFDPDIEVERRVSMNFMIEDIAQDIDRNTDTLNVRSFKFALDQFNLIGEEFELGSSNDVDTFIFSYDQNANDLRMVIDVGLGLSNDFRFNSYKMFLRPVPDNSDVLDNDFYGENRNYSLIIKGSFNGKDFTIRSATSFDKVIDYETVEVNEDEETLVLVKSVTIEDIFVDENDQIIDPTVSENRQAIIDNFRSSLQIEGFAADYY